LRFTCSFELYKAIQKVRDVIKATGSKARAPSLKAKACQFNPKAMFSQGQTKVKTTAGPGQ